MLLPMFAMVCLTLFVGCYALSCRIRSVKSRQTSPKAYRLMQADNFPESVIKSTRNFNNQFETPVLFYVACLGYIALGIETTIAIVAAWLFVIFRIAHAIIHLSYNHLIHRLAAFWLALMCILVLWINLIIEHFIDIT